MKKQSISLSFLACLVAFSLVSCVSGPMYPEVKQAGHLTPKAGKGLVVIYCPGGFAGKAAKMPVWVNDQMLPKPYMRRGGFYTYDAAPGAVTFSNTPPKTKGQIGRSIVAGAVGGTVAGGPIGTVAGAVGAAVGATIGSALAPSRKVTTVNVSPGHVYYLNTWGRYVKQTTREEAEEEYELTECHWLNSSQR
ncbi:hypothetical protein [Prosthecobacter sp.]|uniref:hypothetical protein n=1 Tax=Prosthecobacter sp. TaxID=1965333 RepID=UPI003783BB9F